MGVIWKLHFFHSPRTEVAVKNKTKISSGHIVNFFFTLR